MSQTDNETIQIGDFVTIRRRGKKRIFGLLNLHRMGHIAGNH